MTSKKLTVKKTGNAQASVVTNMSTRCDAGVRPKAESETWSLSYITSNSADTKALSGSRSDNCLERALLR